MAKRFVLCTSFLLVSFLTHAQISVEYQKLDNDPYRGNNVHLTCALWGLNSDRTGIRTTQALQLNYRESRLAFEARLEAKDIYVYSISKNSNTPIPDYIQTYIPLQFVMEYGFRDHGVQMYHNMNAGEHYVLPLDVRERYVKSVRLGYMDVRSTAPAVTHYIYHTGFTDSFYSYHRQDAQTIIIGYSYKHITDFDINVPSYHRHSKGRNEKEVFADILFAPYTALDPFYHGVSYDVSKLKKEPFGARIGGQIMSARHFGFYGRIELGLRPGLVYRNTNLIYGMFSLGIDASFCTHKKHRSTYTGNDWW